MPASRRVFVVDDHVEMARLVRDQLVDFGYAVELFETGGDVIDALRRGPPDLLITDLRMEHVDGLDVLDAAQQLCPDTPVIIMTAFGVIESAVEAIKRGAYQYLTKPLRLDELTLHVDRALSDRRMRVELRSLRKIARQRLELGRLIGRSAKIQSLFDLCQRVAVSSAPILIRGESGTGKELVARAIHAEGPRRKAPFVPVNCTALPDALLESELFGHVRGAFTGATTARRGLFNEADGGTLFLDEIGDMELGLQAKVLRAVDDGEIRAVGADSGRRTDVRLIAATNQDLEARVKEGRFRADLFYRLNVVPVVLPPLRARPEDIPLLVEQFLGEAQQRNPGSPVRELTAESVARLCRLPWPGNVRELENLIERLVVIATKPVLDVADLQELAPGLLDEPAPDVRARHELVSLRQLEAEYIDWVVDRCGGNKTRAAEILGVDVSTIHRRRRTGG